MSARYGDGSCRCRHLPLSQHWCRCPQTECRRVCPELERGRLVYQIGTADPALALAAAQTVQRDVSCIDLNMGCPKKFSVQVRVACPWIHRAASYNTPDSDSRA